ncbi:hypothetical protein CU044_2582 [Streptomyces sp. L-9-10]|uniref:hypothetical protein n=1 Tax=Streptomyces sp. L-9-10 TaxID=1478131 RepID=UPI00101E06CA|nr:hypothetical protein [Streptomyces sp. L-9-10]RYJ28821.1 hypothetical protein CU044_2582 [Streptomyces sp. L-9-10]
MQHTAADPAVTVQGRTVCLCLPASFPHLQQIYDQAVPVLLALTTHTPASRITPRAPEYRPARRDLEQGRLAFMLGRLDCFAPALPRYDAHPWPLALADAWHTVRNGTLPHDAARTLWPHYIHRVRTWLTSGCRPAQRAAELADTQSRLITALTTDHPARSLTS